MYGRKNIKSCFKSSVTITAIQTIGVTITAIQTISVTITAIQTIGITIVCKSICFQDVPFSFLRRTPQI
jgi:hypothetical protein